MALAKGPADDNDNDCSLFPSGIYCCLRVFWCAAARMSELELEQRKNIKFLVNPSAPNDLYTSRTAPLTSKGCILYIYSTNVGTEYFKHAVYSPFFSLFKMQFVS